jgi:hypothetical protein
VPVGRTESDFVARCIVASTRGQLHAAHCRIISNRFNACLGGMCRELVLKDCHLLAGDSIGVFWNAEPAASLNIEGCQFENRIAVSILSEATGATATPPRARLSGNTFASNRALQIMLDAPPRQPLAIHAERNLLDCDHLFMLNLVRPPRSPKGAAKLDDLVGLLRSAVAWTEGENVHRTGMNYIMRGVTARPASVATADIQSLPAWLELWKLASDVSIAGEIRFAERAESSAASPLVLEAMNNATGPLSKNIGAIGDRLGPGPAYHAWRASANYPAWPHATP